MVGANNAGFSRGLPGRVIQTGHLSDDRSLALAYAAADIYLFPSLADNCPLSVIESLSVGTPVLALQRAGTPELIEHGRTGWLISDPDPTAFASALRTLLGNPTLLHQMSVTAAQTAQHRFSLENHGAEVESFYAELTHARDGQL
jgi:glycosyltransferase involved in cell wall biosynthesis